MRVATAYVVGHPGRRNHFPGFWFWRCNGTHDELKVISRISVIHYRNTDKSLPEIAWELSVATILEGGVQRSGNQVRINVQLINDS